jgi:hypothetical protein
VGLSFKMIGHEPKDASIQKPLLKSHQINIGRGGTVALLLWLSGQRKNLFPSDGNVS